MATESKPSTPEVQQDGQEQVKEITRPSLLPQIAGTAFGSLAQLGAGIVGGFSGVMLPQLTDGASEDLFLNQNQVALFGSLVHLGSAFGCLLWTLPMACLGQRQTMLIHLPVFLGAWLGLAFAPTVWMLLMCRFILGMGAGILEAASYSYVTELAHSKVRGQLVGTADTARQIGVLLVYSLGTAGLSWRHTGLICGCVTIPVWLGLFFLPNSPRWLATRGRVEECRQSLAFFRGSAHDCSHELKAIAREVHQEGDGHQMLQQLKRMRNPQTIKTFVFVAFLMFAVQFTGNIVVLAYAVPIFNAAKVDLSSYMSAVVLACVRILGTVFSLFIVDRSGRRPSLIVAFLVCCGSLVCLGTFFFLRRKGFDLTHIAWLPVTTMVVFTFVTCVGHPVLNLVRGELLPTSIRHAADPLIFFFFFGGMFLVTQTYPPTVAALGEEGAFWSYGAVCLIIVAAVAAFVPETRGKILEDITKPVHENSI